MAATESYFEKSRRKNYLEMSTPHANLSLVIFDVTFVQPFGLSVDALDSFKWIELILLLDDEMQKDIDLSIISTSQARRNDSSVLPVVTYQTEISHPNHHQGKDFLLSTATS